MTKLEALEDAVRLSAIALLGAACLADDHGDKKSARYFDKRAHANLKLIGKEPPFMKKRRVKK